MSNTSDGVRAGGAYVEISVDSRGVASGLSKVQQQLNAFGQKISQAGRTLVIAGAAMTAPLALAVRSFTSYGDQIAKMAKRTGFGVQALSELKFAADLSGLSIEEVENGLKRMSRVIFDAESGLLESKRALESLGISLNKLKVMAPEQQFETFASAIGSIIDPTTRAALAQEIFGRSGTMLLPLFAEGADGLKKMREEARKFRVTLSPGVARAAEELDDSITRLHAGLLGMKMEIAKALLPTLSVLIVKLQDTLVSISTWISVNERSVNIYAKVTVAILAIGTALVALGAAIKIVSISLVGLRGALLLFGGVLKLLTTTAIAHLIVGLITLAEAFGLVDLGVSDFIRNITIAGRSIGAIFDVAAEHILAVYDIINMTAKAIPGLAKKTVGWVEGLFISSEEAKKNEKIKELAESMRGFAGAPSAGITTTEEIRKRWQEARARASKLVADDSAAIAERRKESEERKKRLAEMAENLRKAMADFGDAKGKMFIAAKSEPAKKVLKSMAGTFESWRVAGVAAGGVDKALNDIAKNTADILKQAAEVVRNTRNPVARAGD